MAKIAFIGLGHMGGGMAPNLAKAGHEVRAFDLVPEAVQHAAEGGCIASSSAADSVKDADVVITMLPAAQHVRAVFENDVAPNAKKGALLIDCSTIDVASAREIGAGLEELGFDFVDAPVSGGIAAAASGQSYLHGRRIGRSVRKSPAVPRADGQGGDPRRPARRGPSRQNLQQHDPRCDHGRDLRGVRHGAEARARPPDVLRHLVQGVGPELVDDDLLPGPGVGPDTPADHDYEGGFAAALMLKDLKLAMDAAKAVDAYTPMGGEAEELYQRFVDRGGGAKDFSGIIKMIDDSWKAPNP